MKNAEERRDRLGVFARKSAREKSHEPRISAIIIFTLVAFILGGIVLANNTMVPELARAEGEIVTSGHAHRVETLSGGIVRAVLVKEGQEVSQNEILAILSSPNLSRDIKSAAQQLKSVNARINNLQQILTYLDGNGSTLDEDLRRDSEGTSYVYSRLSLYEAQQQIAKRRIGHLAEVLIILEEARVLMRARILQSEASVARLLTLFDAGNITRLRLDSEQQSLDELRGRQIEMDIELATNRTNYAEAREGPLERELALREQSLVELSELEQDRGTLIVQHASLEEQRSELVIRAPRAGVIQSIDFPRFGEVIEAGTAMFELIGNDDRLVAEIKINTADIGHIKVGDAVSLKLTTYDARRYGNVTGVLASVSPSFVVDPVDGRSYFRGVVELDRYTIGKDDWQRTLRVGMAANAEIVTDTRSMMAYLAKPVHRSLQSAFSER